MRKIVVTEFISLDGVIEDPGGAEGYKYGGWSMPYFNDKVGEFKLEELVAADALLLGRVTYEGFAKAWPEYSDEAGFADRMNNYPKYVVSRTLQNATWNNSTVIRDNVIDRIKELKNQDGRNILVGGSAQLSHFLRQNDLVDEYRLAVHPVILGTGKRLFQDTGDKTPLQLVENRDFGGGSFGLVYTRA
jgi:dihydrofolate reductase